MRTDSGYPPSDHCDGRLFYNLDRTKQVDKGLLDVLRWKLSAKAVRWPAWVANSHVPLLPGAVEAGDAQIIQVNHATQLVLLPGLTVLTDPLFSKRASPLQWMGPKRVRPPGIALAALPPIDVVVVSHNHYDHLDMASLQELAKRWKPQFVVPLGNRILLQGAGIDRVVELDWWQSHSAGENRRITLVPAQHWSARGIGDRCRTLWGGYVVQAADTRVFFAGDTGYGQHFKLIRERIGPMTLSLLPIGAYEPRWFMKNQHMNPDDAVQAHLELQSRHSFGMHWGTFQLTDEAIDAPPEALRQSLAARGIDAQQFVALENGQSWRLRDAAALAPSGPNLAL